MCHCKKIHNRFSDDALAELLEFLKEVDIKMATKVPLESSLNKILVEDRELLSRLAQ